MIKIYGLKVSNFSSMVRFALMEKNIEFEWVETFPFSMSGDKTILDKSTNGAVPILEYDGQFISETLAIMSFLEKKFPEIKLISDDPLEHAKTIEIIKILEIYIETSARNFYPFVYFGGEKKEDNLDQIKETINRGLSILEKKASLSPFMVSKFSYADIFASMSLFPAQAVCEKIYNWNILSLTWSCFVSRHSVWEYYRPPSSLATQTRGRSFCRCLRKGSRQFSDYN